MPTVKEIVKQYLEANGFDGLCWYNDTDSFIECGCLVSDLMCCNGDECGACEAGYRVNCTEACGEDHVCLPGSFHIQEKKPEPRADTEIERAEHADQD